MQTCTDTNTHTLRHTVCRSSMSCLSSHWSRLENNPHFLGNAPAEASWWWQWRVPPVGSCLCPRRTYTLTHTLLLWDAFVLDCTIVSLVFFNSCWEPVYIVFLDPLLVRSEYIISETNLCRQQAAVPSNSSVNTPLRVINHFDLFCIQRGVDAVLQSFLTL